MLLQRPDEKSSASRLADWLELLAISQPDRAFGGGELQKLVRLEAEDRTDRFEYDEISEELEEGEITGRENGEIVSDVFDELERRTQCLGNDYPFTIEIVGKGVSIRRRIRWNEFTLNSSGCVVYTCCLVISARRLRLLEIDDDEKDLKNKDGKQIYSDYMYGLVLQICAAVALGGYLRGEVVWFGYPRPDHSQFLLAHRNAWTRFGAYRPVDSVPFGAASEENDAGIDLIGWISFSDSHGSKILVIGQVASGANWTDKSVKDRGDALKTWFAGPAYNSFFPAMIIPFNITDARKTVERAPRPDEMRAAAFEVEERQFGIVLDRDRLTSCAARALDLAATERSLIDGVTQFEQVLDWVEVTRARLVESNNA